MSTTIKIKPYGDNTSYTDIRNCIDIRCSWEVNRAGMFACRVPLTEFTSEFTGPNRRDTFVGAILKYEHATAGNWYGRIMQFGVRDGIVEINAQSLHILAQKRLADSKREGKQAAGAILYGAIYDQTEIDTKFKLTVATTNFEKDSKMTNVSTKYGVDLYNDIVPAVTDDVGMEWRVDENRVVTYGKQLGTDRTEGNNAVILAEGVQVISASWSDDLSSVTNYFRGVATLKIKTKDGKTQKDGTEIPAKYKFETVTANKQTQASATAWGPLMERRDYGEVASQADLTEILGSELEARDQLYSAFDLEVVDIDAIWSKFIEGDRVNVQLGRSGYPNAKLRVMVRALDVTRGVMSVSGLAVNPR